MASGHEIIKRKVGNGITVWADKRYIDSLVDSGISSPIAFINKHAHNIIDDVTKSKITSVSVNLGGKVFRIAAKEYLPRGGASFLKNIFRPSKARTELIISSKLARLDVPVPDPVAVVEIRSFRFLNKAYLFNREIVGGRSLLELMDAQVLNNLKRESLNDVISVLAKTVSLAHNAGLFHGDLNASHLVVKGWENGEPEAYLIDFENSRIRKNLDEEEKLRDLARLERSASYFLPVKERLRFLKYYLDSSERQDGMRHWIDGILSKITGRSR